LEHLRNSSKNVPKDIPGVYLSGREAPLQGEGPRFDPLCPHQEFNMSYSEKYPLFIKSVDYRNLDVTNDSMSVTVFYADNSVKTFLTEDEIAEVGKQLEAQVAALNAGETISYRA
jgi:hypothetical protein